MPPMLLFQLQLMAQDPQRIVRRRPYLSAKVAAVHTQVALQGSQRRLWVLLNPGTEGCCEPVHCCGTLSASPQRQLPAQRASVQGRTPLAGVAASPARLWRAVQFALLAAESRGTP